MSSLAANTESRVRPLSPADLPRIVAIDLEHVGEPRHRFFEKRLVHAVKHPEDFVHVGVARDGMLVGFAFARIQRGEFGREQALATLDAFGVEHGSQNRGGLTEVMRGKGVESLQSQADWTNHPLLRFFDASGFGLAPRLVLERSVLTPLAEPAEDE